MFYKINNLIWGLLHWLRGLSVSRSEDVQQKKMKFCTGLCFNKLSLQNKFSAYASQKAEQICLLSSFITDQLWNKIMTFFLNVVWSTDRCRQCFVMKTSQNTPSCSSTNWTERGYGSIMNYLASSLNWLQGQTDEMDFWRPNRSAGLFRVICGFL